MRRLPLLLSLVLLSLPAARICAAAERASIRIFAEAADKAQLTGLLGECRCVGEDERPSRAIDDETRHGHCGRIVLHVDVLEVPIRILNPSKFGAFREA